MFLLILAAIIILFGSIVIYNIGSFNNLHWYRLLKGGKWTLVGRRVYGVTTEQVWYNQAPSDLDCLKNDTLAPDIWFYVILEE